MSQKLFESSFLTVDLTKIVNSQKKVPSEPKKENPADSDETKSSDELAASEEPAEENETSDGQTPTTFKEWGELYNSRVEANNKMSPGARQNIYTLETKFFKEFFAANWEAECAAQLILMGESLKKALKSWGFDEKANPILAFIIQPKVKETLIKTKLLNSRTINGIIQAVLDKKLVYGNLATSTLSKYNIIFCADLYRKSPEDMVKYIGLQNEILKISTGAYTVESAYKNIKVLIHDSSITETDPTKRAELIFKKPNKEFPVADAKDAKLNSLDLAKVIKTYFDKHTGKRPTGDGGKAHHITEKNIENITKSLNTPARRLAALMALSVTSDSTKARQAITSDKFGGVSRENLTKAMLEITEILPKGKIQTKDVDILTDRLLSEL